ncbi:tRNA lysidine(34) synthetase TilS [Cellulomonas sp. KRMCY2]|uniref:tRNA lysidine(34) synthetase TilS n=1 Tax=Cellulomonas sp. KRMCY2 TaxID=1304865 RepID=UPI00045EC0ED|nr:tRNA lysidine(34) synthetase TilS [Cellulomonas sp. KRMCY2]
MSGPDPAVAAQRSAVRAELADLPPGVVVLVACSGGADSLALAAATAFVAARAGLLAGAVVVDHGLQPGSAGVARRAAEQCRGLGLDPVEVITVEVGPAGPGGGPEAAARTARYDALREAATRHGDAVVLLGHTLDDQAESVLLGLARGSGARSLSGMARRRGRLRRPFLAVRRDQTERACRVLGLEPWHDPTNLVSDAAGPLRSQVRHEVLPVLERVLGPGVAEALARTAEQLRQDGDLLDELAGQVLLAARSAGPAGDSGADPADGLDVVVLAAAPPALRHRVLRAALLAAGVPAGALHRVHIEAVDALVTDWHGQAGVAVPGGGQVQRRYGRLTVINDRERGAGSGGSFGHG